MSMTTITTAAVAAEATTTITEVVPGRGEWCLI